MTILFDLSDDILVTILSKLSEITDLVAFSQTSSRSRRVAHFPRLWRSVEALPIRELSHQSYDSSGSDSDYTGSDSDYTGSDSDYGVGILGVPRRKSQAGGRPKRRRPASTVCTAAVAMRRIADVAGTQAVHVDLTALTPRGKETHLEMEDIERFGKMAGQSLDSFACPASSELPSKVLTVILKATPVLRELTLNGLLILRPTDLGEALAAHRSVENLALIDCGIVQGNAKFLWDALSPCAAKLVSLDLSGCPIRTLPVLNMAKECGQLEKLIVNRCHFLTWRASYPGVGSLREPFRKLRWFCCNAKDESLRVEFVKMLSVWQAPLQTLTLNTSAVTCSVRSSLNAIGDFRNLKHLAVAGLKCDETWFEEIVLGKLCMSLQTLDVSANLAIDGSSLASHHRLPFLEKIVISGTAFTEESLKMLAAVASQLYFVKADGCRSIHDRSIRADPGKFLNFNRS